MQELPKIGCDRAENKTETLETEQCWEMVEFWFRIQSKEIILTLRTRN